MSLKMIPIAAGKATAWKEWAAELTGPRKRELDDMNKRHKLTRHSAWLSETSQGQMAVVLHEGPGADKFIEKLATSNNEFDVWFRKKVEEFHGMDLKQRPPGPDPQLYLDSGA